MHCRQRGYIQERSKKFRFGDSRFFKFCQDFVIVTIPRQMSLAKATVNSDGREEMFDDTLDIDLTYYRD